MSGIKLLPLRRGERPWPNESALHSTPQHAEIRLLTFSLRLEASQPVHLCKIGAHATGSAQLQSTLLARCVPPNAAAAAQPCLQSPAIQRRPREACAPVNVSAGARQDCRRCQGSTATTSVCLCHTSAKAAAATQGPRADWRAIREDGLLAVHRGHLCEGRSPDSD